MQGKQYYFLNDINQVGKVEDFVPYLYDPGKGWIVDNNNIVMDRVMGYDGESIGSSSVLFSIDEITEEEANEKIKQLNS